MRACLTRLPILIIASLCFTACTRQHEAERLLANCPNGDVVVHEVRSSGISLGSDKPPASKTYHFVRKDQTRIPLQASTALPTDASHDERVFAPAKGPGVHLYVAPRFMDRAGYKLIAECLTRSARAPTSRREPISSLRYADPARISAQYRCSDGVVNIFDDGRLWLQRENGVLIGRMTDDGPSLDPTALEFLRSQTWRPISDPLDYLRSCTDSLGTPLLNGSPTSEATTQLVQANRAR